MHWAAETRTRVQESLFVVALLLWLPASVIVTVLAPSMMSFFSLFLSIVFACLVLMWARQ
jgi:hypothetical protein